MTPGEVETPKSVARFGKPGLKKYLLARLSRVKEIFRKDMQLKQKEEQKDPTTDPPDVAHAIDIPEPAELPAELPVLPVPQMQPPTNEVLRVASEQESFPRVLTNPYGNMTVQ